MVGSPGYVSSLGFPLGEEEGEEEGKDEREDLSLYMQKYRS